MALSAGIWAASAQAHDLEFTYTIVVFKTDATFQADVTCDLDALALGVAIGADSEQVANRLRALPVDELERRLADVKQTIANSVHLSFDGVAVTGMPSFPEYGHTDDAPIPTVLGLTARFKGSIPQGARAFTVSVDRRFPPVYLTLLDEATEEVTHQVLVRGARSDAILLQPGAHRRPSKLAVARGYVALGFSHILPNGLDHILFVVGLFLLSAGFKPLLVQVTAFTAAHTLTLALSAYGVVRLAPSVVEPLIALSIAYVAIENLFTQKLTRWRPAVVFAFGLLHGLGFAGVLGELGIPEREFFVSLVSFNAGVELGQLAVLALAFVTLGWFRDKAWYHTRVTIPLSVTIAIVGLYWMWARL